MDLEACDYDHCTGHNMQTIRNLVALGVLILPASGHFQATAAMPDWAYAIPVPSPGGTPASAAPTPDLSPKQLPGSTLSFTRQQISDGFGPADWFPTDHPSMPEIVARGRRPDIRACALCHYPNGKGRPENAGISGLPVSYFIQTMSDFKTGVRKSAEPRKNNTNLMIAYAKAMTDQEIKDAAEYFAAMTWTPWIRVVETKTVPRVISRGGMWMPAEGGAQEPIGVRIVETPANAERTDLRDPRSGFIAYAPVGSIKKGEALVRGGGTRTIACGVCHGSDLMGMGPVPGIAGRSPSYLARQMYDMQTGARRGEWTALMTPVVAKLTDEDFVNITAYLASLMPPRD
jgi:cytochrome c553